MYCFIKFQTQLQQNGGLLGRILRPALEYLDLSEPRRQRQEVFAFIKSGTQPTDNSQKLGEGGQGGVYVQHPMFFPTNRKLELDCSSADVRSNIRYYRI